MPILRQGGIWLTIYKSHFITKNYEAFFHHTVCTQTWKTKVTNLFFPATFYSQGKPENVSPTYLLIFFLTQLCICDQKPVNITYILWSIPEVNLGSIRVHLIPLFGKKHWHGLSFVTMLDLSLWCRGIPCRLLCQQATRMSQMLVGLWSGICRHFECMCCLLQDLCSQKVKFISSSLR